MGEWRVSALLLEFYKSVGKLLEHFISMLVLSGTVLLVSI